MKKALIILTVIAALLLCGVGGFRYFQNHNIVIGEQVYSRQITTLDLSGQPLAEPKKLAQLKNLEHLDLRGTGLTTDLYNELCDALPQCQIEWDVPFQNTTYPQDTTHLTVTALTSADIAQLAYFPQLTAVDATGCSNHAMIMQLKQAYPNLRVSYLMELGSQKLPQDTQYLSLGDGTVSQLAEAMAYLPQLKRVDATGCLEYGSLEALKKLYPDCTILYKVKLGGRMLSQTVSVLDLDYSELAQLDSVIAYLPHIKKINVTGNIPSNDDVLAYQQTYGNIEFNWSFQLFGVEVTSLDKEIDLSGIQMEDTQEVEASLKYFRKLERVIMCNCGISNEEMDALGQRNPDVRFVWMVRIAPGITVRTDITYFMPYQFGTKLTDADTKNLKYLVDLEALDLGHNKITDVSFLAYMPHLKYLVIADAPIRDISACANLKELVFAEFFMTYIRDYSPLLNCTNLVDLNIGYAIPRDVTVFYQMTWLENLWMRGYWDYDGQERLQAALPNTNFVFGSIEDTSATGSGWRELDNYYAMRDALGMFYMTG